MGTFTGIGARAAGKAMTRLVAGGLVRRDGYEYEVLVDVIQAAVAAAAPPADPAADDPTFDSVLRAYLRDGRIRAMPAQLAKRRILLEHVAMVFEVGVRYPELEVEALLRVFPTTTRCSAATSSTTTCSAVTTASTGVPAARPTSERGPGRHRHGAGCPDLS